MKTSPFIFFIFLFLQSQAQIFDNFNANSLSGTWLGQTQNFTVSGGQLVSNGPNLTSQKIYIAQTLPTFAEMEWQFLVNLDFAPSSTNQFRFYLLSNQLDFTVSSLSGYYIEIGETNQDRINLYKTENNNSTKLFSSTGTCFTSTSANFSNVRIKITRNTLSEWSIYADCGGNTNFELLGTITDNSLAIPSPYFGILCDYATASRFNLFKFDEIYTGPIVIDNSPPSVTGIKILSLNKLEISFSERLSVGEINTLSNYTLSPAGVNISQAQLSNDKTKIYLELSDLLAENQIFNLGIENLKDENNNKIESGIFYPFQTPYTVKNQDLVINEIMADPSPAIGLPEIEYLEIFNKTSQNISLENYIIQDGNTLRNINYPLSIAGNGYLIICNSSNSKAQLEAEFPTISVGTLAGFGVSNSGETFKILSPDLREIDKVSFTDKWYKSTEKIDGGWSLELINPFSKCSGGSNWAVSTNEFGGTPGAVNSVFKNVSEQTSPHYLNFQYKASNQLEIVFSEQMDSVSLKNGIYKLNQNPISISLPLAKSYDTIRFAINSPFIQGKVYTFSGNNLKDCSDNELINNNLLLGIGRTPLKDEVVINEIMADETPAVNLPEAEFVEIFNTTNELLDLSGLVFYDSGTEILIPANTQIFPKSYLILTSIANSTKFNSDVAVLGLSGFPSLNNSGEKIGIKNQAIISEITYKSDWYNNTDKNEGGWSLERINPYKNCGSKSNWLVSNHLKGATPGVENSVFNILPDLTKPLITSHEVIDKNILRILFSESIDIIQINTNNFTITPYNPVSKVYTKGSNSDSLELIFTNPIDTGRIYTVFAQNIFDCYGNDINSETRKFGIGKIPEREEVVINEIMANESPAVGLPLAEFVEIYNPTDMLIDLSGSKLYDGSGNSSAFPKSTLIMPDGYLILCSTTNQLDFKPFGEVLGISSFPSLNSTDEKLRLVNKNGLTISSVQYQDTWYRDEVKRQGGWTLERIDPKNPCGGANNWLASAQEKGGTPGTKNSVFASNPDLSFPILISAIAITPDTLVLNFSENVDSISVLNSTFKFFENRNVKNLKITENAISLNIEPNFVSNIQYQIEIKGIKDCAGNVLKDNSIATFFLCEPADSGEILLNEILFNPLPNGVDFVEIYNHSNKYINLKNWKLSSFNDSNQIISPKVVSLTNQVINPKSYKTLTTHINGVKNFYPKSVDSTFLVMPSFPSYNDDEGNVVLLSNKGVIVDKFNYKDDFHFPLLENKEGVSLEKISFSLPSNTPESWHSASSTEGYATPGYKNSQSIDLHKSNLPFTLNPKVFTPDEDGWNDFTTISYQFPQAGNTASIHIFDTQGRIIKHLIRNHLLSTQGIYIWDGTDDDGKKASIGNYLVLIEFFNLNGEVESYKERVVVGAKF